MPTETHPPSSRCQFLTCFDVQHRNQPKFETPVTHVDSKGVVSDCPLARIAEFRAVHCHALGKRATALFVAMYLASGVLSAARYKVAAVMNCRCSHVRLLSKCQRRAIAR